MTREDEVARVGEDWRHPTLEARNHHGDVLQIPESTMLTDRAVGGTTTTPMTRYVAGFLFSDNRKHVALISKQKPAFLAGKLNAIGGKIEADESPAEAMRREFNEEAGLDIISWRPVAALHGPDFKVNFFAAFSGVVFDVRSMEDEQVDVFRVDTVLHDARLMENCRVLIPLALDRSGIVLPVTLFDSIQQSEK